MIDGKVVSDLLVAAGCPREKVNTLDQYYSCPDPAYIERLGKRYLDFLVSARRPGEVALGGMEEAMDCDDFALFAMFLAKLDHARYVRETILPTPAAMESDPPQPTAIAFGMAAVDDTNVGPHAINFAIIAEGDKHVLHCYEPQRNPSVCLQEIPLSSVSAWLFAYC